MKLVVPFDSGLDHPTLPHRVRHRCRPPRVTAVNKLAALSSSFWRVTVGNTGGNCCGILPRPKTHWKDLISHLALECLGIPQEKQEYPADLNLSSPDPEDLKTVQQANKGIN